MQFYGLIPRQVFFLDLKRGTRVLFVLQLKSVESEIVVRPICSSLMSLKRGARELFLIAFDEVERKPNFGLWLSGVGIPV